ncbi:hypothetical protein C8R45DRAFT_1009621 [Mycena sanguinolenta]|nr:hypothetical protein C8R45DRAFT_1009621 [Mycena sanguinolenta]
MRFWLLFERTRPQKSHPGMNRPPTDAEGEQEDCHSGPASATLSAILLDIIEHIQETFDDFQFKLRAWMAEDDPNWGQAIIERLQKDLASMKEELQAIVARDRFNLSSSTHNTAFDLDQMIAELVAVRRVAKFLRELVNLKKSLESWAAETATVLGDITGGAGGAGSNGCIGGEGGGPHLSLMNPDEKRKIGNVRGGLGGNGGNGIERGGKGGVGQGPVIKMRRC